MTSNSAFFDVCTNLVMRGDFSHSMGHDHKVVSGASCRLLESSQDCPFQGACIVAKHQATGRPLSAISRR